MEKSQERIFQDHIVDYLGQHGWKVGTAAAYDRARALYPEDVLAFVQSAHPEQWGRLQRHYPQNPDQALLDGLARNLQRDGTLSVLRHGYKDRGARLRFCQFKPDHGMNPETLARYRANRLRVVPEVSYAVDPAENYNPRLDLVLFVNGIPVATLELKSAFKQSVDNAKRQYRRDRPPKNPNTRRDEPLLAFKRGALVHFVVSQEEVWMSTRLAGKDTFFLPFNRGTNEGGAGNPPNPQGFDTAYLWEQVFQLDAWLKILGRFIHLQKEIKEDFHGRRYTKETLIFPRFHQWEVVNELVEETAEEGPGKRYLVQHSAGSGKSNSIAWTAHQLASLYGPDEQKLFQSVIVVTDRTVLDAQLQETIYQFEHAGGVVCRISREEGEGSKSAQLAQALEEGTPIIVVTLQTFPALYEALDKRPALKGRSFAVIADEAHSSQTGSAANKLKALLGADAAELGEEPSAEDLLDAAVAARRPAERISYYAFTATPKAKTIEMFGRPPRPELPPADDNKPEPTHVYTMRQAIEEGFILDVLRNYTSYNTAWKIAHQGDAEREVDSKRAATLIAKWLRLHPHNIGQKVEIIVEHFRDKVAHRLDGQAKAMLVTGSRREAVRYQLAMRRYAELHGYGDVHPMVAFSGSVEPDEAIPEEVTETSRLLNPGLKGRDLRDAFDTDEYNVMIVANKFQTGFDQPKLCAMYVDKKLQGVDCVQTLSRLNRTFPGKDSTFVLDFVNEPDEIKAAFEPYYNSAELAGVSDPNLVYDLQSKLDEQRIYLWNEVEAFARAFFDPRGQQAELTRWCRPAVDRWRVQYREVASHIRDLQDEKRRLQADGDDTGVQRAEHALKEAGEEKDRLDQFKKDLGSFLRYYEFMSQILDYDDPELEQLSIYARHLLPLLRVERLEEDEIDLSELALTHYRLTKQREARLQLGEDAAEYQLKPTSELGSGRPHDPHKERLAEIIARMNELFGAETTDGDKLRWLKSLTGKVTENEAVMAQLANNSDEQVWHGDYPLAVDDAVLESGQAEEKFRARYYEDEQAKRLVQRAVLQLIREALPGVG
ncbi:type I restriction endonuclease subunit R [Alkalilimnicola sp. S0819]|uniref:type I restriction endonuclease subunit R n=1 Tax=Alkalilimnicola sp. S0819 TaxID=2613922 RepID=UPI0012628DC0|nr:type I restriction endonuclease [Alkalilimnicola sp. S0819]KAB7627752.1 type I restriction endonuclease subunit R [Alkalilimnicola sp. S0819]MPQ15375.1 DEAD/DEAH box helicase [Alkalilimnicola sp. S0819]